MTIHCLIALFYCCQAPLQLSSRQKGINSTVEHGSLRNWGFFNKTPFFCTYEADAVCRLCCIVEQNQPEKQKNEVYISRWTLPSWSVYLVKIISLTNPKYFPFIRMRLSSCRGSACLSRCSVDQVIRPTLSGLLFHR